MASSSESTGNHVQNRREGFRLHDRPVVARPHDGRLDEVARAARAPCRRTRTSPPAARAVCDRGLCSARTAAGIDQRTHQRAALERIADAHLPVGVHQALLELVEARRDARTRGASGAALAGRADCAEHDRRHREIQIGRLIDDDGVVAAELEQALAQARGDALADLAAHRGRAGEGDQRHARIVDEARGELGAGVDEQLEDRRQLAAPP